MRVISIDTIPSNYLGAATYPDTSELNCKGTVNVEPNDTIVFRFRKADYPLSAIDEIARSVKTLFPKNNIIFLPDNIEISVIKDRDAMTKQKYSEQIDDMEPLGFVMNDLSW